MDRDEVVGASPEALRLLGRYLVRAAIQIHDLVELTRSRIINSPPLNTPRGRELNDELAAAPLQRMRIVANALAGMAKYLDQRAAYQDLISSGESTGVEPPQYGGFMPDDPNYLLNLGIGGLQVGGGLAGAAGILAALPEPLVSKIAAGGLALYSLFVADAGVRTIMSGGETVAEPHPDQAVEWAALKAGLSAQDAAGLKHGFAFAMGTGSMAATVAGAGMIRPSVIKTTAAGQGQLGRSGGGELDSPGAYIGPGRQLQPGNPTDLTLDQVLRLRGTQRWQAGEDYWQQVYGGRAQQHHDIPVSPTSNYPVEGSGGRFTDFEASGGGGRTLGGEVKTYLQWRTVDAVPQQTTVPLSDKILEQVNKDVVRRSMERTFDPRWVFTDAPPSPELATYLENARIAYISVHPPVKPK
jgi:hypothetical protein